VSEQELHTLTGAYAADALSPEEAVAFETHLETCGACRQEVRELRATTTRLALAVSSPAPAGLRERVLAEVAHTRQLAPHTDVTDLATYREPRPWYRQPATAAAALLLVVAAGLGSLAAVEHRQAERARELSTRIAAVAADPNRIEKTVRVTTGGTGTVVAADGIAVFHGSNLPRLPEGQAYQLWRMDGQDAQSAGVLGRGGALTGVVTGMKPGASVGVTVEPASGSDRPTSDPVFVFTMA
jgi:anti-sigma factor RsiW